MKSNTQNGQSALTRVLALLLMLCLVPFVPIAGAQDKPRTNVFGSSLFENEDYIHTVAVVGDTVYVKSRKAFFSYTKGDTAPVQLAAFELYPTLPTKENLDAREAEIHQLVSDGQQLYALDLYKQSLFTLTANKDKLEFGNPIKLDLSEFLEESGPTFYTLQPLFVLIANGQLFIRHPNYDEGATELYSFNLATGEKTAYKTRHLQQMTPYRDGKFLAVRHDPLNAYDPQTFELIPPKLVKFDPVMDSTEDLDLAMVYNDQSGSVSAIYYDAQTDSLYTHTTTDVLRYDHFKTKRLIGYLPTYGSMGSSLSGGIQPFGQDHLIIAHYNNIFLRQKDEKGLEGVNVLTITGSLDDGNILQNVLMEMDDVVLRRDDTLKEQSINGEQLATLFITGAVNFDLMIMGTYVFDLDKLIEKGYLADLSGSALISEHTSKLEEGFRLGVTRNDGIYAVPATLMLFPVSAYVKNFEAAGLTIPKTIPELVDLYVDWYDHLAEELPEFRLSSSDSDYVKTELMRTVLNAYVDTALAAGQELVFDTPSFREILQKVQSIQSDGGGKIDWRTPEGQAAMQDEWQKKQLLETGMGFEPQYSVGQNNSGDRQYIPLILPFEEGGKVYSRADMNLLAVLSTSKNKEAATRFIEHYIKKLNILDRVAFDKTWTAPVENPKYEEGLKMQEHMVQQVKEAMERAEGAEKSSLEENYRYMQESQKRYQEEGKFLAPQRDIDMLRDVMRKMFISNGLGNAQYQAVNDEYELLNQFTQGAITLDQFIRQLDDKVRLVRMEYQ